MLQTDLRHAEFTARHAWEGGFRATEVISVRVVCAGRPHAGLAQSLQVPHEQLGTDREPIGRLEPVGTSALRPLLEDRPKGVRRIRFGLSLSRNLSRPTMEVPVVRPRLELVWPASLVW
jgi:hypothetical protein